jgi:hypothetical protein
VRGETAEIPVRWFEGTVKDAIAEANRSNGKTALPLTGTNRQNFTWRMVRLGLHSKEEIKLIAGVSYGQVGNMRAVLKKLGESGLGVESWFKAAKMAEGEDEKAEGLDDVAMLDALADSVADEMARKLKPKLARNPKLLAMALLRFCGRNAQALANELDMLLREDSDHPEPQPADCNRAETGLTTSGGEVDGENGGE